MKEPSSSLTRWLGGALLLSLAFNGFLLTPRGKRSFKPGSERRFSVEAFETSTLSRPPETDAARFKQAFESHRDELAKRMEKAKLAREAVRAALSADPFNRAAVETAFVEQQNTSSALRQTVRSILLEAAEKMTRQGRTSLLDNP
jgi:hypothetical protein